MSKDIFKMSKDGKSEYCCNVVRIGEITPIEGSDFLAQTVINGDSIVVRKDEVKEGDLMLYASNECQLNLDFLAANNLFEIGSYELNSNAKKVEKLINDNKKDEAKKLVGFFNKRGRVKMIRLRGVPSFGFLFSLNTLAKWKPEAAGVNLEDYVGKDFDTVCDELFVKAYVPYVKPKSERAKSDKRNKKLKRFDRIIEGEFKFHYDTDPLAKNMSLIKPDDVVTISVKVHGTSAIIANVKTRIPKKIAFYKRMWNWFIDKTNAFTDHRYIDYEIGYDNVYSSRNIIKNKYINKDARDHDFYGSDIWGEYSEKLFPYIPKGMTVYGEIFGYLTGESKMIQKGYDYGCKPGHNKMMIYRITTDIGEGKKYEWDVLEVRDFTNKLIEEHPEIAEWLQPIPVLYHGTLKDLYPDISIENHWHENILAAMQNDKEHFGMELNEPMCNNKVAREGIVLRIDNDPVNEAFKLKTVKFREKEKSLIDNGEVDMEMMDAYVS